MFIDVLKQSAIAIALVASGMAVVSAQQLDHHNQIGFRIAGPLWAQPVPLELLLKTDIDLETGRVAVRELDR